MFILGRMRSLKPICRTLLLLALLLALMPCALADMPQLRGYDSSQSQKYIYVTFGNYFSDGYGGYGPVLWRVLGSGIPGEDDVSTDGVDENDNSKKSANMDVITEENADVYCFLTEYIIDFHQYNEVRDTREGVPLEYKDSELYRFCTETSRELDENGQPIGLLGWLFTEDERAVLMDMPGRGLVSPPSRKGELFRLDYGFINEDFRECLRRQATGTYYAFDQGLKYIVDSWSWYWTTDRRRVGFRWIVGDNGHTSVAGADREGGVRLVCYPHTDQLECIGGTGTKDDPYQLITKSAYRRSLKSETVSAMRTISREAVRQAVYAVSRAQAAATAREAEQARLAAAARAEEEARVAALRYAGQRGITRARIAVREAKLDMADTLRDIHAAASLRSMFEATPGEATAGEAREATPAEGVIFRPAESETP